MNDVANHIRASVADQLAFDALPEDVKVLVHRLHGDLHAAAAASGTYTEDDLKDAFEAGWEACGEQIETPYFSEYEWTHYIGYKKMRK